MFLGQERYEQIFCNLLSPDYLEFHNETDSLMAVPLIFHDLPWGLYSIELPFSKRLGPLALTLIARFAQNVLTILWKVDAYETNRDQTQDAIHSLSDFLRATDFHEFLKSAKTAFMARPFTPECEAVETAINEALEQKHAQVKAQSVVPDASYVLDEIIKQIQSCVFGIVDITGCTANVVMELGMMASLGKPFLIFRRADDTAALPFNVGHYSFHRYEFRDGMMKVIDPGTGKLEPVDTVLEPLLR
jgi:nucleoside 2-deoxyribosyltransferase